MRWGQVESYQAVDFVLWLAACTGITWPVFLWRWKKGLVNVITLWDRWSSECGYVVSYDIPPLRIFDHNVITLSRRDAVGRGDEGHILSAHLEKMPAQAAKVFRAKW